MMQLAPDATEPADAVLGVRPSTVVEPASLAEAAETMRALAVDRLAVAFVGGGTDLELGAPPARLDVVLRTRRLARIREHAPSDQIVAVEAGMTVAALQRALAPHGQRLALDPPAPERATVGGVVAANAFGPRRARHGPVRDLVIGVTLVRADGVVARGGGKVVKNVAGFDLPRLLCGSLGTLGLVAEVVFRLHPLPEVSATAVFEGLAGIDVREAVVSLGALAVEPTAVAALSDGARLRLAVRFEGFAPGVRDQLERLLARTQRGARLDGADEAALWARHDAIRAAGAVRAKATFAPAALVKALDALAPLRELLGATRPAARGEAGGTAPVAVYPTVGVAFLGGEVLDVEAAAAAIATARAALAPLGHGALVLTAAPPALRARTDVWGAPPPGLDVMRRLKRELDPDARLAPGRFVGGL